MPDSPKAEGPWSEGWPKQAYVTYHAEDRVLDAAASSAKDTYAVKVVLLSEAQAALARAEQERDAARRLAEAADQQVAYANERLARVEQERDGWREHAGQSDNLCEKALDTAIYHEARAEAAESQLAAVREWAESRAEDWRGKARANAVVDGPMERYAEYLARAAEYDEVVRLLDQPPSKEPR